MHDMRFALLVILLFVVIGGPIASARVDRERGPWLLTSLPSMGSITWRCTAGVRPSSRAYALGFRALASGATDEVRLLVNGRVVLSRTVQPGGSVAFPHLPAAVQRVEVTQGTEPRTLKAAVSVDFDWAGYSYCWSYLPPPVTVRVTYAKR
jgi:hypothetical protein